MKKYFSLNNVEKIVLFAGVILIVVAAVLGIVKSQFSKEQPYESPSAETGKNEKETTSDKLQLKKDRFVHIIGETLDEKPATYLSNTAKDLKDVKMDFSNVDPATAGTYTATATKGSDVKEFTIVVAQSKEPIFAADHVEVYFYLEANSTMQEVKDYANVTAKDVYGNDISANITGWGSELPAEAQTIVYPLTVKDAEGNTASLDISVIYMYQPEE